MHKTTIRFPFSLFDFQLPSHSPTGWGRPLWCPRSPSWARTRCEPSSTARSRPASGSCFLPRCLGLVSRNCYKLIKIQIKDGTMIITVINKLIKKNDQEVLGWNLFPSIIRKDGTMIIIVITIVIMTMISHHLKCQRGWNPSVCQGWSHSYSWPASEPYKND